MATVHVVIGYSKGRTVGGAPLPVYKATPSQVDTVTSSGTSAPAAPVATQAEINDGAIWSITALGNVWVNFGTGSPTAAADSGWLIPAGATKEFAIDVVGQKVAIVDAT